MVDQLLIHRLADGDDNLVGLNRGEIVFVKDRIETFLAVKNPGATFELHAGDGAVAEDAFGAPAVSNLDVFRQRGFDFFLVGRHLFPLFEADQFDIFCAQAQGGPGNINRNIPAADDQHAVFHHGFMGRACVPEKFNTVKDALDFLAFNAEFAALLGPGRDEDGIIGLLERLDGDIPANAAIIDERDALAADDFDFVVEHLLGQAIPGNAPAKHAAGGAHRFVNDDGKTGIGKVVGRGKTRRAAADHRHLFGIRRGNFFLRQGEFARRQHFHFLVRGEPFQQPDGDGIVGLAPRAFGLAGMCADAAADGRKRISLADEFDRLEIFFLFDELDVALDVDPGRARHFAGRVAIF